MDAVVPDADRGRDGDESDREAAGGCGGVPSPRRVIGHARLQLGGLTMVYARTYPLWQRQFPAADELPDGEPLSEVHRAS